MGVEKEYVGWFIAVVVGILSFLFISRVYLAGRSLASIYEGFILLLLGKVLNLMGLK